MTSARVFLFSLLFCLASPVSVFGQEKDLTLISCIEKADSLFFEDQEAAAKNLLLTCISSNAKGTSENLALAHHKIGVYDFYLNDYHGAADRFKKALSIREDLLPDDHPDIIKGYFNIGNCYYRMNNYSRAREYLSASLAHQSSPPSDKIHPTHYLLGRVYDFLGQIEEGTEYLEAYILHAEQAYADDPSKLAFDYVDHAAIYCDKPDKAEKAIDFCKKGIDLIRNKKEKSAEDWHILADAYHHIGLAEQTRGNLEKAIESYRTSLDLNTRYREANSEAVAFNLNNLGIVYNKTGKFDAAEKVIKDAIRIKSRTGNLSSLAVNYDNLGDIMKNRGEPRKALEYYHEGLTHLLSGFNSNNLYENPDPENEFIENNSLFLTLLSSKAATFFDLYRLDNNRKDLDAAISTYALLEKWVDKTRTGHLSQASKIFLAEKTKPALSNAISARLLSFRETGDQHHIEKAFQLAEKSKAIILLEAWQASKAKKVSDLSSEVIRKEEQLKFEINWYKQEKYKLEQSDDPPRQKLQLLADSILFSKQRYAVLLEEIKSSQPRYFDLISAPKVSTIKSIQNDLSDTEETLVEYVLGDRMLTIFVISGKDFHVEQNPIPDDFISMIDSIRFGLFGCRMPDAQLNCEAGNDIYVDFAVRLYGYLLKPVEDLLTEKLIIIPDEIIGYIPFEALLFQHPGNGKINFRNLPYLIKRHQVSYAYSFALLNEAKSMLTGQSGKGLLAFAPSFTRVSFRESDLQHGSPATGQRATLSPLNFNEEEVEKIIALSSGRSFVGGNARRSVFLEKAPDHRFIHLSSHGYVNDRDPRYSFIAFTQLGENLDFDELLFVNDLYGLSLDADLVVLSACNTGFGKLYRGEGIISLARAFSYAGARSIITSLWSVNDRNTSKLMSWFYTSLKDGKSKDGALRAAKLKMIKEPGSGHPFFWAGFIPVGNMEPVKLGAKRPATQFLLIIAIATLIVLGGWLLRKKISGYQP